METNQMGQGEMGLEWDLRTNRGTHHMEMDRHYNWRASLQDLTLPSLINTPSDFLAAQTAVIM